MYFVRNFLKKIFFLNNALFNYWNQFLEQKLKKRLLGIFIKFKNVLSKPTTILGIQTEIGT